VVASATPGDHVFDSLLENKKIERDDERCHITDYELKRYSPTL
jgi:hypothetical protein